MRAVAYSCLGISHKNNLSIESGISTRTSFPLENLHIAIFILGGFFSHGNL